MKPTPRYEMLPELAEKRWFFHQELEDRFNCSINAIRGRNHDSYTASLDWSNDGDKTPSKQDLQHLAAVHNLEIVEWEVESEHETNLRDLKGFMKVRKVDGTPA